MLLPGGAFRRSFLRVQGPSLANRTMVWCLHSAVVFSAALDEGLQTFIKQTANSRPSLATRRPSSVVQALLLRNAALIRGGFVNYPAPSSTRREHLEVDHGAPRVSTVK